jgi:phenylalanyl-tRNA synthetase beta chain
LNSLDKGSSLLKNNAVLQAVEAVVKNLNKGVSNIKMYEWTRLFLFDENAANGVCSENKILWGLTSGSMRSTTWQEGPITSDPLFLKGLVEELGIELRLPFSAQVSDGRHSVSALLHPKRQATIYLGEEVVGILGEIHPRICKAFKIKRARPCYFEMSEEAFWETPSAVQYALPPVYQPLQRTISFGLPHGFEAQRMASLLAESGAELTITDRFDYKDAEIPMRAITYDLRFDNPEGDLSADSCNQVLQELIQKSASMFGDLGVVHR